MRVGQQAVESGVEQMHQKVDRFVQASIDRLGPVRKAREEMDRLRGRLEELETSLARLEGGTARPARSTKKRTTRRSEGES